MPEINQNEKRLKKLRLLNILKTNNYRRNSLRLRNGEALNEVKQLETYKQRSEKRRRHRNSEARTAKPSTKLNSETAKPSTKLNGEAIKT